MSTYHPQANEQVERYNRTLAAMLRSYVNDHQDDQDEYASAVTHVYSCQVPWSTRSTLFELVLGRAAPDFSL